jgi:hypothetical protein
MCIRDSNWSVSVFDTLEWSLFGHGDVVCLILVQFSKFGTESVEVESSDFLVKLSGKNVDFSGFVFVVVFVLPQVKLGEDLVGERV